MKKILCAILLAMFFGIASAQNAIKWEYFFDVDLGFGQNTVLNILPPDTDVTIPDTLSIPVSLTPGYHKFYSRVQDDQQRWSHTTRRNVEVIANEDSLYVVEVEYFFADSSDFGFDSCHGFHITVPFTDHVDTFYIPYNQIPFGKNNDTLFIRVRDSLHARWSLTTYIDSLNYGTVGMEEKEKYFFKVSPNPAVHMITIEFADAMSEPYQFSLSNILGEVLERQVLMDRKTAISLNYPNGIYFITLRNSSASVTRKIVIQNM